MSNPPYAVVLDASFVIGLCAKEPGKYKEAQSALQDRIVAGCSFHSPHLLVMEVCYVLCGKLQAGILSREEYDTAHANLQSLLSLLSFSAIGDSQLIGRADQLREGYGCSRSADSFYIALAEQLGASAPSELLTFDIGQLNQVKQAAVATQVTILPIDAADLASPTELE